MDARSTFVADNLRDEKHLPACIVLRRIAKAVVVDGNIAAVQGSIDIFGLLSHLDAGGNADGGRPKLTAVLWRRRRLRTPGWVSWGAM